MESRVPSPPNVIRRSDCWPRLALLYDVLESCIADAVRSSKKTSSPAFRRSAASVLAYARAASDVILAAMPTLRIVAVYRGMRSRQRGVYVRRLHDDSLARRFRPDEENRMKDLCDDGAKGSCPELLLERGGGDLAQRLVAEFELDLIEGAEALVFGDHRLPRLGEDGDEIVRRQRLELDANRQASHQLGKEPILDEILAGEFTRAGVAAVEETHGVSFIQVFHVGKRARADEEDVGDVDLDVVVLVPVRRDVERYEDLLPFENLQQGLLNSFSAYVARAGAGPGSAGAPGDLVDLVDENDAVLGASDV